MKILIAMRHANAPHLPGMDDLERKLDEVGFDQAARAGKFLFDNYPTDQILSSPTIRTMQTLYEMTNAAEVENVIYHEEELLYTGGVEDILELVRLEDFSTNCLLVLGHNPTIYEFVRNAVGSGEAHLLERLEEGMPPANMVIMEYDGEWGDFGLKKANLKEIFTP